MKRPETIMARVISGDTIRGARILHKNPAARSWAGEMVEITVASAALNATNELTAEAVSCRGEERTVHIEVFTTLTAGEMERLYVAALDRRSDVPSALKRLMTSADGSKRGDDIAPPA